MKSANSITVDLSAQNFLAVSIFHTFTCSDFKVGLHELLAITFYLSFYFAFVITSKVASFLMLVGLA